MDHPPIPCRHCGTEFTPTHKLSIYCSPACARRGRPGKKGPAGPVTCCICGKTVRRTSGNQVTCGDPDCQKVQRELRRRPHQLTCRFCGREFDSKHAGAVFCSVDCREAGQDFSAPQRAWDPLESRMPAWMQGQLGSDFACGYTQGGY